MPTEIKVQNDRLVAIETIGMGESCLRDTAGTQEILTRINQSSPAEFVADGLVDGTGQQNYPRIVPIASIAGVMVEPCGRAVTVVLS